MAPGLASKSLRANLRAFKLEPLARKVLLRRTLLAATDLALKKGEYNYTSAPCSSLPPLNFSEPDFNTDSLHPSIYRYT